MNRSAWIVLAAALVAAPAAAQTESDRSNPTLQTAPQSAPQKIELLSRFAFRVGLEHMSSDERRYVWDANFGGELDIVDYGRGRGTFTANYETILGNEFRAFDPNQGNYTLEGAVSARQSGAEVAGVFHHVSRHLSDRPKRFPVDWNMIGGRIRGGLTRGVTDLQTRADIRGVIQKSFVDYRWEFEAEAVAHVHVQPRVAVIATGTLRLVGVNGSRNRGTQHGFRVEGGIRLDGRAAHLDLFLAGERRIDPYQLEFSTATWLMTGFRLSSVP